MAAKAVRPSKKTSTSLPPRNGAPSMRRSRSSKPGTGGPRRKIGGEPFHAADPQLRRQHPAGRRMEDGLEAPEAMAAMAFHRGGEYVREARGRPQRAPLGVGSPP